MLGRECEYVAFASDCFCSEQQGRKTCPIRSVRILSVPWSFSGSYLGPRCWDCTLPAPLSRHYSHSQRQKWFRSLDWSDPALAYYQDRGSMQDRKQGARLVQVALVGLLYSVSLYLPSQRGRAILPWSICSVWGDKNPTPTKRIEPPMRNIVQNSITHSARIRERSSDRWLRSSVSVSPPDNLSLRRYELPALRGFWERSLGEVTPHAGDLVEGPWLCMHVRGMGSWIHQRE